MRYHPLILIGLIVLAILFVVPLIQKDFLPQMNSVIIISILAIGSIPSTIALIRRKDEQYIRKLDNFIVVPAIWLVIGYVVYCYLT
jgi:hypothetical protein